MLNTAHSTCLTISVPKTLGSVSLHYRLLKSEGQGITQPDHFIYRQSWGQRGKAPGFRAGARTLTQVLWVTSLGLPGSFRLPSSPTVLPEGSPTILTLLPFSPFVMSLSSLKHPPAPVTPHYRPPLSVPPLVTVHVSPWSPPGVRPLLTLSLCTCFSLPFNTLPSPAGCVSLLSCWFQRCSVKPPWPAGLPRAGSNSVLSGSLPQQWEMVLGAATIPVLSPDPDTQRVAGNT